MGQRVDMKEKYIKIRNLSISEILLDFVNNDLLPGTKIKKENFWSEFDNRHLIKLCLVILTSPLLLKLLASLSFMEELNHLVILSLFFILIDFLKKINQNYFQSIFYF